MSLLGRYVIDRLKRSVAGYLKFPVPPYDDPTYWERVYRHVGPDEIMEWGNFSCKDLLDYQYHLVEDGLDRYQTGLSSFTTTSRSNNSGNNPTTTLDETIQVYRQSRDIAETTARHEAGEDQPHPILILGCGNSKLGEDMIEAGWHKNSIIQVDVASTALDMMATRCAQYIGRGEMRLIQDDAMELSAFNDGKLAAVIDKGLLDSVFCADAFEDCYRILNAVHRVLKPNGLFVCLSLSRPEFLLGKMLLPPLMPVSQLRTHSVESRWRDIQVRQLDRVLLYRFQKAEPTRIITKAKRKWPIKRR